MKRALWSVALHCIHSLKGCLATCCPMTGFSWCLHMATTLLFWGKEGMWPPGSAWPWRALRPCKKPGMIANLRRKGRNWSGKLWLGFWLECYHPPDFLRKDSFWTHHWNVQLTLFGRLKSSPHPWPSESHNTTKFSLCSPVSLIFKILAEGFQTRDEHLQFCVLYEEYFYNSSSRTLFLLFHFW